MGSDLPFTFNAGVQAGPEKIQNEVYDGWHYWRNGLDLGAEWWPTAWVSFGGNFSVEHLSGDVEVVGGRGFFGSLRLAPRFRPPLRFLDHLYFAPDIQASKGYSWISHEVLLNPSPSPDNLFGFGGRLGGIIPVNDRIAVDLFLEASSSWSLGPQYDYDSQRFFAGAAFLLGQAPSFR